MYYQVFVTDFQIDLHVFQTGWNSHGPNLKFTTNGSIWFWNQHSPSIYKIYNQIFQMTLKITWTSYEMHHVVFQMNFEIYMEAYMSYINLDEINI